MKAIIMNTDRSIEYKEMPSPSLKEGEVKIRVAACGICGTDMHVYKGMACSWALPGIIGHEFSGIISACAPGVAGYKEGDKVTVQPLVNCGECTLCKDGKSNLCGHIRLIGGELPGGFAEEVAVPADALVRLPVDLPVEYGALAEPAATAVHAVGRLGKKHYGQAMIFGAGAIGLLTLSVLRKMCDRIVVSDVDEARLQAALSLGAESVILASKQDVAAEALRAGDGKKYDLAVDAAGFSSTRRQGLAIIKPGGDLLYIALGDKVTEVDFMQLVTGELTLYGTQCHTKADFYTALELMENGTIDYQKIVTRIPLSEAEEAFRNPYNGIKIHLIP